MDRLPFLVEHGALESCLAPGVVPSDYERLYHGRNLDTIVDRRLFS